MVPSASLLLVALAVVGCKKNDEAGGQDRPLPDESDPRVVRDTDGDLYAKGSEPKSPAAAAEERDDATNPPGVGKPDESNGECRLFAPEFKTPECCPTDHGFDVEWTKTACGHEFYLGEHQRQSCGYYFLPKEGDASSWIRVSIPAAESAQQAADDHALLMQVRMKVEDYENKPIPGVEGGSWGKNDGLNWGFLPGFDKPRLVSWPDGFCSEQGMMELLAKMANEAQQPGRDAKRQSLVPTALKKNG